MITFKLFLIEQEGVFAAYKLDSKSASLLHDHVLASGIPNAVSPDKYHITTVHSPKGFKYTPSSLSFEVQPQSYEYMGREENEEKILALKVHHEHLHERWNHAKALGAEHSFPTYNPHISVTQKMQPTFDHTKLKLPNFKIHTSHEYTSSLNESVEDYFWKSCCPLIV